MVSTCALSRYFTGAALGYVGASPWNSPLLGWIGAGVGVLVAYAWQRWVSRASACSVARGSRAEPNDESSSATTSHSHPVA